MPRPKSKTQLLTAMDTERQSLQTMLKVLRGEALMTPFAFAHRDRSVRDVVGHLAAWHRLFLRWYSVGMSGGAPEMPSPGFTWKTTPQLNLKIHTECQSLTLQQVRRRFNESYRRIREIVVLHSDEELFARKRYSWTGSTSLGSYVVSATSAHYAWAHDLFRRHRNSLPQDS